jgi:hypothetical protein
METHFWEGDIMFKLQTIILVIILSLVFLQGLSNASIIINWTSGDYNIPHTGWFGADMLNTYNNVTVTMPGGGGRRYIQYV